MLNPSSFSKSVAGISPDDEDMSELRMFTLIDLDKEFYNTPSAKILNNDTLVSKQLSKEYTDAIYSNCDAELGFVPTCECGALRGVSKEGLTCHLCGTVCSSHFVDTLSHQAWVGIPDSMAPVLHPIWYAVLSGWSTVGRKKISVIDIILNPEEEVPDELEKYIHGRGFWYFYQHADEILDMLFYQYPKTMKKPNINMLIEFRKHYRNVMFTRHLPILHNSLHPLKSNGGSLFYADKSSKEILAAIIDLSAETFREHATAVNVQRADRAVFDIYKKLIAYYQSLITNKLGRKVGILRKHNFGSRIHFSFRSVVSPQSMPYPMDEVILPWCIMVQNLKLVILNYLQHRYFLSMSDALSEFMRALTRYDERIDQCIQTYINECPDQKMAIILGRNPTLAYGSIMLLYVKTYKKDPSDETIAINAGICAPANIGASGKDCLIG